MKSSLIIAISLFIVSLSDQTAALSLESCASIEDPAERLTCFDKLTGRLPADKKKASDPTSSIIEPVEPKAEVVSPSTPAEIPTVPLVESTPKVEAIFGLEHKQKPEKERPDELKLKWTRKKKDAYGKWIITLENGQVWRQTDSKSFRFTSSDQLVVISRGLAGGFFLGDPERKKRIRVKRIK